MTVYDDVSSPWLLSLMISPKTSSESELRLSDTSTSLFTPFCAQDPFATDLVLNIWGISQLELGKLVCRDLYNIHIFHGHSFFFQLASISAVFGRWLCFNYLFSRFSFSCLHTLPHCSQDVGWILVLLVVFLLSRFVWLVERRFLDWHPFVAFRWVSRSLVRDQEIKRSRIISSLSDPYSQNSVRQ